MAKGEEIKVLVIKKVFCLFLLLFDGEGGCDNIYSQDLYQSVVSR